jgi:hypothetical protein
MSLCFKSFPISTGFGLWLQWLRVQVPSLTLPFQGLVRISCLSLSFLL